MAHRIGIIGGSGLYDIEGLENQSWSKVDTPFGSPSDELLSGTLAGREVVFSRGMGVVIASFPANSIIEPTFGP